MILKNKYNEQLDMFEEVRNTVHKLNSENHNEQAHLQGLKSQFGLTKKMSAFEELSQCKIDCGWSDAQWTELI